VTVDDGLGPGSLLCGTVAKRRRGERIGGSGGRPGGTFTLGGYAAVGVGEVGAGAAAF
jgi:hypothetical protein